MGVVYLMEALEALEALALALGALLLLLQLEIFFFDLIRELVGRRQTMEDLSEPLELLIEVREGKCDRGVWAHVHQLFETGDCKQASVEMIQRSLFEIVVELDLEVVQ